MPQKARKNPEQVFRCYSFPVNTEDGSAAAIKAASEPFGGRCPDAFFLCAGASRPGFFVEQSEESIKQGMEQTYYAQAFTALVRPWHAVLRYVSPSCVLGRRRPRPW